jgi:hypothetical protein
MSSSIILKAAYGIDIASNNDPFLALGRAGQDVLARTGRPGAYMVDLVPWLKFIPSWMPGMGFKRQALADRKYTDAMIVAGMDYVKQVMVSPFYSNSSSNWCGCYNNFLTQDEGANKTSIAARCLRDMEDEKSWTQKKEDALREVLGTMYSGLPANFLQHVSLLD